MNFFEQIQAATGKDSENSLEQISATGQNDAGAPAGAMGFGAHARPLQDPSHARSFGARDYDRDGIPDNIDYHFGPGQYSPF